MEKQVEKLYDTSNPNRWQAAIALATFGAPAVDALVKALEDDDKWVRYVSCDSLGKIAEPWCVPNLVMKLEDPDQDVRFAAAEALGNFRDVKIIDALTQVMEKDNPFVKVAAEESLAKIQTAADKSATG